MTITNNLAQFANSVSVNAGVVSTPLSANSVTGALGYTPLQHNETITFTGDASGSGGSSVALTLANSGATAGTYTHFTVDAKGRITSARALSNTDVTGALGFTPYNSTNPSGYISGINSSNVTTALGYTPYNSTNPSAYITGINSSMVTTALGYTPLSTGGGTVSGIVTVNNSIRAGDIYADRGDSTGVIFFGSGRGGSAGAYLYYNGTYNFNTGATVAAGGIITSGSYIQSGGALYLSSNTGIGFYWDGSQIVTPNSFYSSGNGNFNNTYNRSDRRIKTNIVPAGDVGSIIDRLSVNTFNKNGETRTQYGVIAQEVEEVLPDSVITIETPRDKDADGNLVPLVEGVPEDIKSVDNSDIMFIMLRELQSLRARMVLLEGATIH